MLEQPTATAAGRTLCEVFDRTVAACGPQLALRSDDGSSVLTWSEYAAQARSAAAGLAGLGVGRGDTVACWLSNRPELNVADSAALRLGAAPFSLHPGLTCAEAQNVIGDASSRVLITEPAFLGAALAVRDARTTALETIVLVEGADARALTWSELLDCASPGFDVDAAAHAVRPEDVATLIYVRGGAGPPTAIPITHGSVVSLLEVLRDGLALSGERRAISWLPMADVVERLCVHYLPMRLGWSVTTCSDPRALPELIGRAGPALPSARLPVAG